MSMASGGVGGFAGPAAAAPANPRASLRSEDFINLLITQLRNQDPLQPMKNSELLQQVSQIGQLQSSHALQGSLREMLLQNQISAASGMIGRLVAGLGESGEAISGVVTTVRVVDNNVVLELDNGRQLALARVTDVAGRVVSAGGGGPRPMDIGPFAAGPIGMGVAE